MSITRNNSIWSKFLAVLLVVALLFTFVLPRPQAKAVALVDDALLLSGAAVAVMIAAGIYFTSQNTDVDTFGAYISGKIDDFISSEGTGSVSEYASGISLNPNGIGLNVNDPTMGFLDRFFNWFKADENLTSDTSNLLPSAASGTGIVCFSYPCCFSYQDYIYYVWKEDTSIIMRKSSNSSFSRVGPILASSSSIANKYPYFYFNFDTGSYSYDGSNYHRLSVWLNSNLTEYDHTYAFGTLSASYSANPSYSYSGTQTGTLPFIIVIDESAAGGSGGNNNKHDTARDAAISALQLGLAGKLLSSVTQSSSDPGQEGGDSNVSADVSGIRAAVNSIKNWLDTGFKTFSEVCTQFFTDVRLFFADFWTNFTTKLKEVFKTSLESIQDLLGNIKTGISSAAEAIKTAISTAADTIGGKIDSIGTKISDWWEEWRSSKNDKPTSFFGSGFNSIWHYVVEWLSYIGGFLSLVLNVWSVLPYGMVVPVYAAVVLVLYFGIYRKFIK